MAQRARPYISCLILLYVFGVAPTITNAETLARIQASLDTFAGNFTQVNTLAIATYATDPDQDVQQQASTVPQSQLPPAQNTDHTAAVITPATGLFNAAQANLASVIDVLWNFLVQ